MQIDLIDALGGQTLAVEGDAEGAGAGEFPRILQSQLDGEGQGQDHGASEAGRHMDPEAGHEPARAARAEGDTSSSGNDEAANERHGGDVSPDTVKPARADRAHEEQAEAAANAGVPGEWANGIAERLRPLARQTAEDQEQSQSADVGERGGEGTSVLTGEGRGDGLSASMDEAASDETTATGLLTRSAFGEAEAVSEDEGQAEDRSSGERAWADGEDDASKRPAVEDPRADRASAHFAESAAADRERPTPSEAARQAEPAAEMAAVARSRAEGETTTEVAADRGAVAASARREVVSADRGEAQALRREQAADVRADAEPRTHERAATTEVAEDEAAVDRTASDRVSEEAAMRTAEIVRSGRAEAVDASLRAPQTTPVDGVAGVASPVAGMMTETTPTAPPGVPAPAAAAETIAVQTEWLATRGGGTARLLLHPPELGELAIRVTLRAGAVDVVVVAQEHAAADVADKQLDRLAQAFAGRDLRLEHFEVRRGDPDGLAPETGGQFAESGSGQDREAWARDDESRPTRALPGLTGNATGTRAVPRIATVAAATGGVDLRI